MRRMLIFVEIVAVCAFLFGCSMFVPNSNKVAMAQAYSAVHYQLVDYESGKAINAVATLRYIDKALYMQNAWLEGLDTTNIPAEVKATWPEAHPEDMPAVKDISLRIRQK